MRITGLATGLDMDELVKSTMQPYRIKIQQQQQKKEILEIKQKLYRDVIKESRDLYNKYFDVSKSDSLLLSKNWSNTKFESSDDTAVSVKGTAGANAGNYKVNVKQLATSASITIDDSDIKSSDNITIKVNVNGQDKQVNISTKDKDTKSIVNELNAALKKENTDITAKYSEFSKGIVLEAKSTGADSKFEYSVNDDGGSAIKDGVVTGQNANVSITNSRGEVYEHISNSNNITLDGVIFQFNDITNGEVRITGKIDTTSIKDKLVNFVNDYNKLMENLNKLTMEKKNSGYSPLTDEQKKEMSEEEIKLWNDKVQKGQLSRDSDLTRITNKMKQAMSSIVEGVSGNLEKFGIKPVADYQGTKNGTFTIDEDKLNSALENNCNEVMNLFISSNSDVSKSGIAQKLKSILYDETVTVNSPLLKKAGMEGSVSASNNEISRQIEKYNRKMSDMEKDFSRREQALYSKWATVEKMMNNLNSQQSSLYSQLGM